MIRGFKQLDDILRGNATSPPSLGKGQVDLRVGGLTLVVILLGGICGLCIGSFAVIRTAWSDTGVSQDAIMQMLASVVKLPLLFIFTLLVTLPSLYVFNALVGSRLSLSSVYRLLVAMLGVMLAVLASLGPITVFFGLSTDSYPFMKLLNVAMASVAGVLGLAFLLRTLHRLVTLQEPSISDEIVPTEREAADSGPDEDPPRRSSHGVLDRMGPTPVKARVVFRIWLLVFSLVGAQMSWVLRPFIGNPDVPFTWLRSRQSNFFMDVLESIGKLFGN